MEDYVYIMDYSDCTISVIDLSNDEDDDIDRIMRKYGFNPDTCSYMYTQNKIKNIIKIN